MELLKQDLETLETLKNIIKSNLKVFKEMERLEKSGLKDTLDFKNCIEELKRSLVYQDNILNRLVTGADKLDAIMNYLRNNFMYLGKSVKNFSLMGFSFDMFPLNEDDMIFGCLSNLFIKKYVDYPQCLSININGEMVDECTTSFQFHLNQLLNIDLYRLVLALNERNLTITKVKDIQDREISLKYRLGFLSSDIMEELINNGFNVEMNPMLSYLNVCHLHGVSKEVAVNAANVTLALKLRNSMMLTPDFDDTKLFNIDNLAYLINLQHLIRAILVLFDEPTRLVSIDSINGVIQEIYESGTKDYFTVLIKLLKDIPALVKKDVEVPIFVSFGRM